MEDVERLIVIRKMTCRKLREGSKVEKSVHGYTEPTMGQLQKSKKGSEKGYHEREEEIEEETVKKIREQDGTGCKLFWTDLRGRREG